MIERVENVIFTVFGCGNAGSKSILYGTVQLPSH
jgi:hypothetical protein